MAVEIALLQKFGLFLGHPNYALSVVLAALLLFSGVGSLFSTGDRAGPRRGCASSATRWPRSCGAGAPAGVPAGSPAWSACPFAARVALVFALVAPVGVCLGVFMPTGLTRLKAAAPAFAPWAWGINGIFSVLAPLIAVGVSMTWGISVLLAAALPFYLVAGFALPDEVSSPAPSP